MRKTILLTALMLFLAATMFAQSGPRAATDDDIIKVNYQKKSVSTALILSCAVPGLGQFYGNRRSFTTYLFPIIEIGLWAGYINYDNKGSDIESKYRKFADANYQRAHQTAVAQQLCDVVTPTSPEGDDLYDGLGDGQFFHLDENNSQHYYEDIGKYDKFIFGWNDWYAQYAANGVSWCWDSGNEGYYDPDHKWIGNNPTDGSSTGDDDCDTPYSALREHYDDMRKDAESNYDKGSYFTFGLVANHILAGIDAVRVTRKYNADYLSQNPIDFHLRTLCRNNRLMPMLMLEHRF
jgi:hypothetical protein